MVEDIAQGLVDSLKQRFARRLTRETNKTGPAGTLFMVGKTYFPVSTMTMGSPSARSGRFATQPAQLDRRCSAANSDRRPSGQNQAAFLDAFSRWIGLPESVPGRGRASTFELDRQGWAGSSTAGVSPQPVRPAQGRTPGGVDRHRSRFGNRCRFGDGFHRGRRHVLRREAPSSGAGGGFRRAQPRRALPRPARNRPAVAFGDDCRAPRPGSWPEPSAWTFGRAARPRRCLRCSHGRDRHADRGDDGVGHRRLPGFRRRGWQQGGRRQRGRPRGHWFPWQLRPRRGRGAPCARRGDVVPGARQTFADGGCGFFPRRAFGGCVRRDYRGCRGPALRAFAPAFTHVLRRGGCCRDRRGDRRPGLPVRADRRWPSRGLRNGFWRGGAPGDRLRLLRNQEKSLDRSPSLPWGPHGEPGLRAPSRA